MSTTGLMDKVISTKNALMIVLGDDSKLYLNYLKLYFRYKCTKEEFDGECRKLLKTDKIYLHNKFLIALLNKLGSCQTFSKTLQPSLYQNGGTNCILYNQHNNHNNHHHINYNYYHNNHHNNNHYRSRHSNTKKRKKQHFKVLQIPRSNFYIEDIQDFMDEDDLKFIMAPNSSEDNTQPVPAQRYCAQELFLPETSFVLGRLLVTAWEYGLINVDDTVSEYICVAVHTLLKNLFSSIIMKRKHCRVNTLGHFYYDIGQTMHHPFMKNSLKRKIDDGPLDLDKEITSAHLMRKNNDNVAFLSACQQPIKKKKNIVTKSDIYKAMHDRNIIASHAVYSVNMERLLQILP